MRLGREQCSLALRRLRGRIRRVGFGLATVLRIRRLGFFIPYRYAADVKAISYPALEPLFSRAEPAFEEVLEQIEAAAPRLRELRGPAPEPRFDQGWFPRLDAAAAYAMVCRAQPRRILEVGSGHSTRFLARAIRDQKLPTELTCIDPAPRAALKGLPVRWIRSLLQEAPPSCFEELRAGDILFIDSSHVLMPGTDVDRILNGILPALPTGVLVHFHDVFLPDPYPEAWGWRGYNEQSALGTLLQGGAFEIVFASHWLATRRRAWVETGVLAELPRPSAPLESSLWLVKRG